MILDGRTFARAWLSVAQASAKDEAAPVLSRTVALEVYPNGLRLISTDRYVLLNAWVGDSESQWDPEPEPEEGPERVVVARDPDGRGKSLLGYVLSLTDDEDKKDPIDLRVTFDARRRNGVLDTDAPTFDGLEPVFLTLRIPDVETVYLPVVDAEYPAWRGLIASHKPRKTSAIALNPEILERLAKLRKWHPSAPLVWTFGGSEKVATIELGGSDPFVSGLVMPTRWTLPGEAEAEAQEPAEEESVLRTGAGDMRPPPRKDLDDGDA